MNLSELLAVELRFLGPHWSHLTLGVALEEFPSFFGEDVKPQDLSDALRDLISAGVLVDESGELRFTSDGAGWAHRATTEFNLTDGAALSVKSSVDRTYSDTLYNKYGVLGITDSEQRDFLAESLSTLPDPILDIGCGRGTTTGILQQRTGRVFQGIDMSPDSISQAASENPEVSFLVHDYHDMSSYRPVFRSALIVDSLYFARDPIAVLDSVSTHTANGGGIVALHSVYAGPGTTPATLSEHDTPLWEFAEKRGLTINATDHTESEVRVWDAKKKVIADLKQEYHESRCTYLYYARLNEILAISNMASAGRSGRYGYLLTA